MSQEANNIILNSIPPKELPVRSSLNGTEFIVLYAGDNERLERSLVTQGGEFITIGVNVFRHIKGYSISVLNTGLGLEVNDFISDGVIRVNSINIRVYDAMYIGGTITDFGTYDNVTKKFAGGSYQFNHYKEI